MKREKSCGTIIINQNKVLLIGAKETLEEVGLEVEIINQKPIIVSHLIHGGTAVKDIYLFLATPKINAIKPQADEVELYRWVNFNKANNCLTEYYEKAWREARKHKNKYFSK